MNASNEEGIQVSDGVEGKKTKAVGEANTENVLVLPKCEPNADVSTTKPQEKVVLKRPVGLINGVSLIVGTIIGSGIFVSPGQLLKRTGSVSVGLMVWVACGLLSLMGALSFAELGAVIPRNGGEYIYFYEGTKDLHPFFGPLPGFLFVWVNTLLHKPAVLAILTLIFAKYLLRPVWTDLLEVRPECLSQVDGLAGYEEWSTRIVAVLCTCFVAFINCYDVKLAAKMQTAVTIAKLVTLGIIICGGAVKIAQGNYHNLDADFENANGFGQLAGAFYSGLWAYDAWNQLNYVTEEIENPHVILPRAIMIALPLCIVVYVLVNIAYLSVMSMDEIINSPAVAMDFGERVLGKGVAVIMPLAVAVSTFGSSNGQEFTAARISYSAAKRSHLPQLFSFISLSSLSPTPALILNALLAIFMIVAVGDVGALIDLFSFTAWIFYGGSMVVLILMRWTKKDTPRPYKVNIVVPIFVALVSVYLVVWPFFDDPQIGYIYAAVFIVFGVLVYVPFVYYQFAVPGTAWLTRLAQILLQVVPTDDDLD